MIMWRQRLVIAALALTAALSPSACGPDLKGLNISGCMKDCNTVAKQCLDDSDKKLETCAPDDKVCQLSTIHESEACLTSCLDCIDQCVKAGEDQIKK